jgi:hypothetical protein
VITDNYAIYNGDCIEVMQDPAARKHSLFNLLTTVRWVVCLQLKRA